MAMYVNALPSFIQQPDEIRAGPRRPLLRCQTPRQSDAWSRAPRHAHPALLNGRAAIESQRVAIAGLASKRPAAKEVVRLREFECILLVAVLEQRNQQRPHAAIHSLPITSLPDASPVQQMLVFFSVLTPQTLSDPTADF